MSAPYAQSFALPPSMRQYGENIDSLVIDHDEFNALCDELVAVFPSNIAAIEQCKANFHIPMLGRGTKTEFVFDRYKLTNTVAAVIVRGKGTAVLGRLFDSCD